MLSSTCSIYWPAMVFLAFSVSGISVTDAVEVGVSTNDITYQLGTNYTFSVTLSEASSSQLTVNFTFDNLGVVELIPDSGEFDNSTSLDFVLNAREAGKVTLMVHVSGDDNITYKNAFVRVSVLHYPKLETVSDVIGWLYFAAWSISFYPQIISNFRRKSVVGLNFDFIGLNITGFLFYSIFNVVLYFVPRVQDEYFQKYPTSVIPVVLNDVVFALHAAFATLVQIAQCIFFERGGQRISLIAQSLLGIFWSGGFIFLIVTTAGVNHNYPWLTFIYYFSYVKLGITLIKYSPQAYFNFRRKSTDGWSIGNILLDFTGGILSLLQMFIIAYNFNDWKSLFGNLTKFGLGMFSILFDILFIVQHYCLYRSSGSTESLITHA